MTEGLDLLDLDVPVKATVAGSEQELRFTTASWIVLDARYGVPPGAPEGARPDMARTLPTVLEVILQPSMGDLLYLMWAALHHLPAVPRFDDLVNEDPGVIASWQEPLARALARDVPKVAARVLAGLASGGAGMSSTPPPGGSGESETATSS